MESASSAGIGTLNVRYEDRCERSSTDTNSTALVLQALVNMAAITGLMPLTGIPLPFISFGGTSMVSLLAGLGIALNIAKRADNRRSRDSYSEPAAYRPKY